MLDLLPSVRCYRNSKAFAEVGEALAASLCVLSRDQWQALLEVCVGEEEELQLRPMPSSGPRLNSSWIESLFSEVGRAQDSKRAQERVGARLLEDAG